MCGLGKQWKISGLIRWQTHIGLNGCCTATGPNWGDKPCGAAAWNPPAAAPPPPPAKGDPGSPVVGMVVGTVWKVPGVQVGLTGSTQTGVGLKQNGIGLGQCGLGQS